MVTVLNLLRYCGPTNDRTVVDDGHDHTDADVAVDRGGRLRPLNLKARFLQVNAKEQQCSSQLTAKWLSL